QLITTTPRPIALIKRLLADPRTAVTRASTHANAAHLSPVFLDEVLARYAGTRLGHDNPMVSLHQMGRAACGAARVVELRLIEATFIELCFRSAAMRGKDV